MPCRWHLPSDVKESILKSAYFYAMYLKVGLEVHAQLASIRKLFSPTRTSFAAAPNSRVSYFDAALPGSQPLLNWQCVHLAIRAAAALDCTISEKCSFDRKHYMYPDQPSGFQITQFYHPVAVGGFLDLHSRDFRQQADPQRIRLKQIQIEQDTGKSTYMDDQALIDLNRANSPLIELVTEPDFRSAEAAGVFVRKLQTLLKHIGVCAGTMETGAMRVDVNVSCHEPGFDSPRCEIKNLFSTSAVVAAIKAEFERQVADHKAGVKLESETRDWDGKKTWKLRGKEGSIDYRYIPDPEIPEVVIPKNVVHEIASRLPVLPDDIFQSLLKEPFNLKLVDARTLMNHGIEYIDYFKRVAAATSPALAVNWLTHKWLGQTDKLCPESSFIELLKLLEAGKITSTSAKFIVNHMALLVQEDKPLPSIEALVEEYGLKVSEKDDELMKTCLDVVNLHPGVVERIKNGKKGSLGFLLGEVMKNTQGTYNPKQVRETLSSIMKL